MSHHLQFVGACHILRSMSSPTKLASMVCCCSRPRIISADRILTRGVVRIRVADLLELLSSSVYLTGFSGTKLGQDSSDHAQSPYAGWGLRIGYTQSTQLREAQLLPLASETCKRNFEFPAPDKEIIPITVGQICTQSFLGSTTCKGEVDPPIWTGQSVHSLIDRPIIS